MIDNLNYYRVFLAVAETGSISRAAEQLYISQPAVSKSIRNLEDALTVRLIDRSSRGITLTEHGQLLYDHLREAFASIRTAEEELQQINMLGIGELRIGASTSLCRNILLSYLSDFIMKYPHIKLFISCHSTMTTIRKLEEGSIDLGLICETNLPDKLSYHPLQEIHDIFVVNPSYLEHLYIREQAAERSIENPWLLAGNVTSLLGAATTHTSATTHAAASHAAASHVDASRAATSRASASSRAAAPSSLPDMPTEEILEKSHLLLLEQGNVTRNHLDHYFYQQNIQPGQVLDVNNMDLLIDFAKIGMGVSSVVKEFATEALEGGHLIELPMKPPVPSRTVGFSINLQRRQSSSLQKFLQVLGLEAGGGGGGQSLLSRNPGIS